MAGFAHFPTEVLEIITGFLDGYTIASLWFVGEKALTARLAICVNRFDLKMDYRKPTTWPRLLSKFVRLRVLRIATSAYDEHLVIRGVDLNTLAPTLEQIDFKFRNAEVSLLNVDGPAYCYPPADSTRSGPMEGVPSLISVKDRWPQLRSLRLEGDVFLGPKFLEVLPVTLQSLVLVNNNLLRELNQLPPNLTELRLDTTDIGRISLPASLQILSLHVGAKVANYDFIARLPKGLQCLELTGTITSPFNEEVVKRPKVHRRGLSPDDIEAPQQHNPTMTTATPPTKLEWLLPPNLTRLQANFPHFTNSDAWSSFPETLTSLKLGSNSHDIDLSALPERLTYLEVGFSRTQGTRFPKGLPPRLRTLILSGSGGSGEDFTLLPITLTHLVYEADYELMLMPEQLAALPRQLMHLTIRNAQFPEDAFHFLPTTLISLFLEYIPEDINFAHLTRLEDLTLANDNAFLESALATLPPTLRSLELEGHFSDLSDACSASLPRGLTNLKIYGSESLSDEFVEHLPPNLETLELTNNLRISDEGCAMLPKRLANLSIGRNSLISDEAIKILPRTLRRLVVDAAPLTGACFPYLPRQLRLFFTSSAKKIFKESLIHLPRSIVMMDLGTCGNLEDLSCLADFPPGLAFCVCGAMTSKWRSTNQKEQLDKQLRLLTSS